MHKFMYAPYFRNVVIGNPEAVNQILVATTSSLLQRHHHHSSLTFVTPVRIWLHICISDSQSPFPALLLYRYRTNEQAELYRTMLFWRGTVHHLCSAVVIYGPSPAKRRVFPSWRSFLVLRPVINGRYRASSSTRSLCKLRCLDTVTYLLHVSLYYSAFWITHSSGLVPLHVGVMWAYLT